jgi:beta-propeller repeat-containing protein
MTTQHSSRRLGSPVSLAMSVCLLLALCAMALLYTQSTSTASATLRHASQLVAGKSIPETALAKSAASQQRALTSYGNRSLTFEANQGQADPQVKYLSRGHGYTLFLTSAEAVFAMPTGSTKSSVSGVPRDKGFASNARKDVPQPAARDSRENSVQALHMQMLGSNPHPLVTAEDEQASRTNYFIGSDPAKWHANVPQYSRVDYRDVYPGVDLAFHGTSQLEFDFVVNAGANPEQIQLAFRGAKQMRMENSRSLVLTSAAGELHLLQPRAYQEKNGVRQVVDARFVMKNRNRVAFVLGAYDRTRQLVIDPPISYSSYLGGGGDDDGYGIAVDASGNAYVVGADGSTSFPGASGSILGGGGGSHDCFLTQLTPTGGIGFTTIFGGESDDIAYAVAVDKTGIYVTGATLSAKFPVTTGVVGTTLQGKGLYYNGFLAKFAPNGASLNWATYIGGSGAVIGFSVSQDSSQNVYVVGETANNLSHPVVNNLPQGDKFYGRVLTGFLAEVNSTATAYKILSYIGGGGKDAVTGVAFNPTTGNVYVTGITNSGAYNTPPFQNFPPLPVTTGAFQPTCGTDTWCNINTVNGQTFSDAFVASFNPAGTPPLSYAYMTYLGGTLADAAEDIQVDSSGNAYVAGRTSSPDFPILKAYQSTLKTGASANAFVTAVNPTGTGLVYSTYLGGEVSDIGLAIALDKSNNVYITGETSSTKFPVSSNAPQAKFGGGSATGFNSDAFVSELSFNGIALTLPFSTYLGGSGDEDIISGGIAVDSSGAIYVTGDTNSTNFPTTASPVGGSLNGGASPQPICTIPTVNGPKKVTCPDAFATKYSTQTADFSVTLNPASTSVASGQTTSAITVDVASVKAAFGSAVTLSCANKPKYAACNFTTTSVTPGSAGASSTLTISTNGSTGNGLLAPSSLHRSALFYALLLPIGGMMLIGKRSGSRKLGWLLGCLTLCGMISWVGCGGSSSSGGGGGGGNPTNTAAGSYQITVTGTSGSIVHSQTLNLTVQ